jgi:hypothetical protein
MLVACIPPDGLIGNRFASGVPIPAAECRRTMTGYFSTIFTRVAVRPSEDRNQHLIKDFILGIFDVSKKDGMTSPVSEIFFSNWGENFL